MGNQHGNQQVSSAFLDLFAEVARQGDPGQIRLAPDKCEQHALHSSCCLGGMLNPSPCPAQPAQHACCTHLLPQTQMVTHILLPSCCTSRNGVLPAAVTSMCRKASVHAQALHNPRRAILPLRNAIHRLSGAGEGLITPIHADLAQW